MKGSSLKTRLTKAAVWVAGLMALFTIVGFFVIPPVAKAVLVGKLSDALHRRVSIGKIAFNPYTLAISVKDIVVREKDGKNVFVSFGEVATRASHASLYRLAPVIKELKITKPYIHVVRNRDESSNFSDLTAEKPKAKGPVKKEGAKAKPFQFSVNNISIAGGQVDFFDGPKDIRHTVKDIRIGIPFVSNMGEKVHVYMEPHFSAVINGDPYSIEGKTKPFETSLESYLDIRIKDLDIPRYMPYAPVKANFALKSAILDVDVKVSFVRSENKAPSSSVTGTVTMKDVAVDDLKGKPLLRLGSCGIALGDVKPFKGLVHLTKVGLADLTLNVARDREGALNVSSLIGEEKEKKKEAKEKKDGKGPGKTRAREPAKPEESAPFVVNVDEFTLERGAVAFQDAAPGGPVKAEVADLTVKGEKISTAKGTESDLAVTLRLNKRGAVSVKGKVSIAPLAAKLAVEVKTIDIGPFQPYFSDRVKLAVTKGHVETGGTLTVGETPKGEMQVKYAGNALVANFASVERATGDDLFKWKALSVTRIDADVKPLKVRIGGISLADFYAGLAVEKDGALNLKKIVVEEGPAPAAPAKEAKAAPPAPPKEEKKVTSPSAKEDDIMIGAITLQGGTIQFFDKSITPRYSASLTEIAGRVAGFSLGKSQNAEVDLKGKINKDIPLEILGTINPIKEDLFADLKVKFQDLELSDMSPYSAKYMGYKIDKGKLSMDLKYNILKRKLDSENRIFIDQLTLGEKVDSPDALNLPFRLAIALLRDRHGRITLDVPVSGSLDDPQFSVFRIILKIIGNLIAKAATAPFALLASLVGGGEEMSYLTFDYGSAKLTPESMKKVDSLTKALYERPALKLDIQGRVDPEKDKEALRAAAFNRKIKVQKMKALMKKGETVESVDDIKIEQAEYEKYLTAAYKAETFAKPRNIIGMAKSLPVPEMEKLMTTHIVISDGDLRSLAGSRAQNAKDGILKSGRVTADRLFVVEPKITPSGKKEKAGDNRVDFTLK